MEFTITGPVSDPAAAWAAISDTDWINRVARNGEVLDMTVVGDDHDYPAIHGVMAGPLGTTMSFEEDDNRWVHGRFFRQGRVYQTGAMVRSVWEARLTPSGGGVVPSIHMDLTPRNRLLHPVLVAAGRRIRARWSTLLGNLPKPGETAEAPLREIPDVARQAFDTWAEAVASPDVAEQLRRHLRYQRPLALQQMRAFTLADRWGFAREKVLTALLSGVESGVFELYWSVRCPRCYAQTASTGILGDLADHASCASCRLDYDTDLGENVEVLFAPHPAIAPRIDQTFCTLFPASAPEVAASFILQPGESVDEEMTLTQGKWRIGGSGLHRDLPVEVDRDTHERVVAWTPNTTGAIAVGTGTVQLQLRNEAAGRVRVQLTRLDEQDDRVLASYLTTMPAFRRTLSDQVLAPDIRISNRSVALLFTDLTGSTAMYEELGDARAFAVIRDHFRLLREITEAHGGVIVKTIGDAIMAAFHEPVQAMSAALEMMRAMDEWVAQQDLAQRPRLRVGFHVGPALMVHTDAAGIDYFGRTVNIAARTQGVAGGGDIVWTEPCHEIALVRDQVAARGYTAEPIDAALKGLAETTRLYRIHVPAPA